VFWYKGASVLTRTQYAGTMEGALERRKGISERVRGRSLPVFACLTRERAEGFTVVEKRPADRFSVCRWDQHFLPERLLSISAVLAFHH